MYVQLRGYLGTQCACSGTNHSCHPNATPDGKFSSVLLGGSKTMAWAICGRSNCAITRMEKQLSLILPQNVITWLNHAQATYRTDAPTQCALICSLYSHHALALSLQSDSYLLRTICVIPLCLSLFVYKMQTSCLKRVQRFSNGSLSSH